MYTIITDNIFMFLEGDEVKIEVQKKEDEAALRHMMGDRSRLAAN